MKRRTAAVAVGTAGLAVAVATTIAVGAVSDGGAAVGEPVSTHNGMVEGTVWVANENGASLTAIDAGRNKVMTTVTGIEGPHNVQVSPDGRSVWAVSGHESRAVMIDAATFSPHGTVRTGGEPAHVVVSPDGKTAYTTNGADNTVSAIETTTMKSVATIRVGYGPHGLRPSPDGKRVYVANLAGSTLSVIDTTTNKRVTDIEVGKSPAQVAFSPDGRYVYASVNGENAVAKVDVARQKLVGKAKVGPGPVQTYVSPDNRNLLVANQGTQDKPGATVSILDTSTLDVLRTVETGKGAHGIVIEPSSRHAYITNLYADDVAVLDLKERKVVAHIPVGSKPNGISFSPLTVKPRPSADLELPKSHDSGTGMDHG